MAHRVRLLYSIFVIFVCVGILPERGSAQSTSDAGGLRRRAAVTYTFGAASAALAIGGAAAIGKSVGRRCLDRHRDESTILSDFGCGFNATTAGLGTASALVPVFTTLSTYFSHRLHGGTAPAWTGIIGSLLGSTGALFGLYGVLVASGDEVDRAFVPALVSAGLLAALVPTIAVEWSDRRRGRKRRASARSTASARSVMPSTSILEQGLWFGVQGNL